MIQGGQPFSEHEGNHSAKSVVRVTRKRLAWLPILCLISTAFSIPVQAQEAVEYITRLGLFDGPGGGEYTHADGYQYSFATQINDSGYVVGNSARFNGSSSAGYALWVASIYIGTTHRVGLYDAAHTGPLNFQSSQFNLDSSQYLIGHSIRYSLGTAVGVTQWMANALTGVTHRMGLYDTEHTSDTGSTDTIKTFATSTGYATGTTARYTGGTDQGVSTWLFNMATGSTSRIGFYDSTHTSSAGYRSSDIIGINDSGIAAGHSTRYNGTSNLGQAAWVASAITGVTTRVGLVDAMYTRADGFQNSVSIHLTQSGYLVGASERFNGSTSFGGRIWVANQADNWTPTIIGLYDSGGGNEHTNSNGRANNSHYTGLITESGYVAGLALRYNGGTTELGRSAWIASAVTGTTHRLGFTGAEHTRADGYQYNATSYLTNSGYAVGLAERYNNGATLLGYSTWISSAASGWTTTGIGFVDSMHTRSDGVRNTGLSHLSESGYAFGSSTRYNGGGASLGQSAWVASAITGVTTRVGLYDKDGGNEFTRNDGFQNTTSVQFANELTAGTSTRYNGGSASAGNVAWVADGITLQTHRLGFNTSEYTSANATQTQSSSITTLKKTGYVSGISERYTGTSSNGRSIWVASAADNWNTVKIGITDSVHSGANGYQFSAINGLTDSGYAWGYSTRYNGDSTQDGRTAWVYSISDDLQVNFELSVRASDGYAYSNVIGVSENGLAYGSYVEFDLSGNDLGDRAFIWTQIYGIIKLSEELSDALDLYGWDNLINNVDADPSGFFVGYGTMDNHPLTSSVYLAFAAPEPSRAILILLGGAAIMLRRRR